MSLDSVGNITGAGLVGGVIAFQFVFSGVSIAALVGGMHCGGVQLLWLTMSAVISVELAVRDTGEKGELLVANRDNDGRRGQSALAAAAALAGAVVGVSKISVVLM